MANYADNFGCSKYINNMSSPFQQKFMAKNPAKGFTLDQLKKASDKSQKEMVKKR